MQQTRGELLDEFLAFVTEQGDVSSRRIAESVLNRSLQSLWLKHPWTIFQSAPALVRTVPGQVSYPLPLYFGRLGPGKVRNVTLGRELHPLLADDYDAAVPVHGTPLDTRRGAPSSYILGGVSPVTVQPNPAGMELEAWSSSSADTDVLVTLVARGPTPNWLQQRVQMRLQGTSKVELGTWSQIDEWSKGFDTSGDLVPAPAPLTSSRGSVWLAERVTGQIFQVLYPSESAATLVTITFDPAPDSAYDIVVPMIRTLRRLSSDSDQLPDNWGPAVFEDMLVSWRVNTGELGLDANVARPCFIDLVAYDNSLRGARSTVPYGVSR